MENHLLPWWASWDFGVWPRLQTVSGFGVSRHRRLKMATMSTPLVPSMEIQSLTAAMQALQSIPMIPSRVWPMVTGSQRQHVLPLGAPSWTILSSMGKSLSAMQMTESTAQFSHMNAMMALN